MKKYSIFLIAALALGFTACDDVQDVVSIPQSNPQEAIMAADGVTVAAGESLAAGSVNLQSIKDNAAKVAALNIVEVKDLPANQSVKVVMELSDVEDFSNVKVLQTEVADNVAYVSPADWNAAHLALYGKNPMERTSYVRYALYALNGDSEVRLGYDAETKAGVYYNASAINVTPLNPEVWIEEAYYVVVNGDKANAIALAGSGDRFDNPKFSVMFTATDNATWEVYPQSAIDGDAATYGPEDDAKTGNLIEGAAGVIAAAGDYVLTVNMEAKTYQLSEAITDLYVGIMGGTIRRGLALHTTDYITYSGYAVPDASGFVIGKAKSTTAGSYGMLEGAAVTTESNGSYTTEISEPGVSIVLGHATTVPMWLTVDVNALTLNAAPINKISMIGGVLAADWSVDADLTPNDNFTIWTATDLVLAAGEFKFRANHGWDFDWGGTVDDIQYKGSNIRLDEAGTYDVVLDFSKMPYTCTLTKK